MPISFASVEHEIASVLQKAHEGFDWAKTELPKIEAAEPIIEGVTAIVAPKDTLLVRAAFGCLGKTLAILMVGDKSALDALKLEPTFEADLRVLLGQYKPQLAGIGKS